MAKNVVVDGEIVIMKQGKVDFHTLQERGHLISDRDIQWLMHQSPATYVVFDILEKYGKPLVDLPLMERKAILKVYQRRLMRKYYRVDKEKGSLV